MNITTTYHPNFDSSREDAVFYAGNLDAIVTVSNGERSFAVVVCGYTKVHVWADEIDKAGEEEPVATIGDGEQWTSVGITNDQELYDAEARIQWVNNSWYEIRPNDANDEDVFDGDVFHTVYDAVEDIKEHLSKQDESSPWVEVIVTRTTTYRVSGTNPDAAYEWVFDNKAEVIDDNVLSVDYRLHNDEDAQRGACILTPENIATEDDCTTHDHEPVDEPGRYLPGTYPWDERSALDLWNDLCRAAGDDDDQNAVLGDLAVKLSIDTPDED